MSKAELALKHLESRAAQLAEFAREYRAENDSFAAFITGQRPARSQREIEELAKLRGR
jgi:hypothetical protein